MSVGQRNLLLSLRSNKTSSFSTLDGIHWSTTLSLGRKGMLANTKRGEKGQIY